MNPHEIGTWGPYRGSGHGCGNTGLGGEDSGGAVVSPPVAVVVMVFIVVVAHCPCRCSQRGGGGACGRGCDCGPVV